MKNLFKRKPKEKELTEDEIKQIREVMTKEIQSRPPTIGLIGVSGVGKSSTINSLFKTNLLVSHTVAGTKEFSASNLNLTLNSGNGKNLKSSLVIFDAPGLGEDMRKDAEYLDMYEEKLPDCDVILWVMTARNRAIALDQMYLEKLSRFHQKFVFGINQVDLVEPRNWNEKINLPSGEQLKHIDIIEKDKKEKLETIMKREVSICSYSADRKNNLEELFGLLIESIPSERRWIFNGLKNFHYTDFLPEELRESFIKNHNS